MAELWAAALYKSKAWREFRMALIQQRGPICARCGKNCLLDSSELIAHHKIALTPDNVQDVTVTLNPDNVELICFDCHNKEHGRYGYGSHTVYLIYGAPCSGKTTLVNQMRRRGDLMVDMDLLYMAVSGCDRYDKPDNIKTNVFRVRDLLLDQIKTRYGRWHNAFVIGGYPYKQARQDLATRIRAAVVYCEATQEECLLRANSRGVHTDEWGKYIRQWFDEYDGQ